MKLTSREEQNYLEQRAHVENTSSIRDYKQILGEHAINMIDMLHAMAQTPMRVASIARIGARVQTNTADWKALIASEGIGALKEWADVCKSIGLNSNRSTHHIVSDVLNTATDDIIDFMQSGDPYKTRAFIQNHVNTHGKALGYFCALSGRWRKQYDPQMGDKIAHGIQQQWKDYIESLVTFTHAIKQGIKTNAPVPDTQLYHHCTITLLHAVALGKAWDEWVQ